MRGRVHTAGSKFMRRKLVLYHISKKWQCFPSQSRRKVVGARGMEELDARFHRTYVFALSGPPNHHRLVAFQLQGQLCCTTSRDVPKIGSSNLAKGFSSPEVLEVQIGFATLPFLVSRTGLVISQSSSSNFLRYITWSYV